MEIWTYALTSVLLVSLFSLAGILILPISKLRQTVLLFMVSFSVGGLFGDAFIHLIPEAYEELGSGLLPALLIIAGILTFFILEKFLFWRHCHIYTCDEHPHQLAAMNIVSDSLHNFVDGIIIGAAYQVSLTVGFGTTLAVIFHEIPQEIGDFGVLVYSGMSRRKALLFNFLAASVAILGTLISLILGPRLENYAVSLMPFTAGGFIYLAGSDLIPELKKEIRPARSLMELTAILLGVAIMASLLLLE